MENESRSKEPLDAVFIDLLRAEEVRLEIGEDIAERFANKYRSDEKDIVWCGLLALSSLETLDKPSNTKKNVKFVDRMNSCISDPAAMDAFKSECDAYFFGFTLQILQGRSVFPPLPAEFAWLEIDEATDLALAWYVMSRDHQFYEALKAFAVRWSDFDPLDLLIALTLKATAAEKNRTLAVATMLEKWGKLKLPPVGGKSGGQRVILLDRIRKRINRLTKDGRIDHLAKRSSFHELAGHLGIQKNPEVSG